MELGTLVLEFVGNSQQLEAQLKQIKKDAIATAQQIEKGFKPTLKANVDDLELHKLNAHLDRKRKHFDQINKYFARNPLKVRVDSSELSGLESQLNSLSKSHSIKISVSASGLKKVGEEIQEAAEKMEKAAKRMEKAIDKKNSPIRALVKGMAEGAGTQAGMAIADRYRLGDRLSVASERALKTASKNPKIKQAIAEGQKAIPIGKNAVEGLYQGVKQNAERSAQSGVEMARKLIEAAKAELQIKSPSRVFMALGSQIVAGLTLGLKELNKKRYFTQFVANAKKEIQEVASNQSIAQSFKRAAGEKAVQAREAAKSTGRAASYQVIKRAVAGGQAIARFPNRLNDYRQQNYQEIFEQVAKMSGYTGDLSKIPQMKISGAGNKATYDRQKNQIIISRQMARQLRNNPEALQKYSKEFTPLVGAAQEALGVQQQAERAGEVFARISAKSRGKRANLNPAIREMTKNLDATLDGLSLGLNEAEKFQRRAYLYGRSLQKAARTPTGTQGLKRPSSSQMQSFRFGVKQTLSPLPELDEPSSLERVFKRVVPLKARRFVSEQYKKLGEEIGVPKSGFEALKQIRSISKKKVIAIPLELQAKYQIKGLTDVVQDLQKMLGKGLDKLQEKAAALPYFGDAAAKAVGGLKLLNVAGVGAVITVLRFLSVVGKINALITLAASVSLVTAQFDALRQSYINASNAGDRAAKSFQNIMKHAHKVGVDVQAVASNSVVIAGNLRNAGNGMAERYINVAASSASLYAPDAQGTNQIMQGFENISQDATVSATGLYSLMNQMPGALETAARSMGMTNVEFERFLRTGTLLTEDFLPRFIQQLEIENATKAASGGMDTLLHSTNKYNNALIQLQLATGKALLPLEKLRMNILTQSIEGTTAATELLVKWMGGAAGLSLAKLLIALKNTGSAVMPFILNIKVLGAALLALGSYIVSILPIILKMAKEFVFFQLAFEVVFTIMPKLLQSAGGEFKDWADTSVSNLERYRAALDKAKSANQDFASSMPKKDRDVKGESVLEDTFLGFVFGKENVRKSERWVQKGLGLRTFAEKQQEDSLLETDRMIGAGQGLIGEVNNLRSSRGATGVLRQYADFDKQLQSIRLQRRAIASTDPDNITGLRQIRERERGILKQRETVAAPIQQLQASLSAQIKSYEDAIAKYDKMAEEGRITGENYTRITASLRANLTQAEKAQSFLNKEIGDSVSALAELQRNFQKINAELADSQSILSKLSNTLNTNVNLAEAAGSITPGEGNFSRLIIEQEILQKRLESNKQAALELSESLSARGGEEVLSAYKIDKEKTDAAGFGLLATQAESRGSSREQEIFTQYQRLKELELETSDLANQVSQARLNAQRQMADLTRQVADYYRSIERQASEQAIATERAITQLNTTRQQNKLRQAITGYQENIVTQFVDGIIENMGQMSDASTAALDAQSQILQSRYQLEDTLRQGADLSRQLPTYDNFLSNPPKVEVALDLSGVRDDANIQALNAEIENSVSSTENLKSAIQESDSSLQSNISSARSLDSEVKNTTASAGEVFNQLSQNTIALGDNRSAVDVVNQSLQISKAQTEAVTITSSQWGAGLQGVGQQLSGFEQFFQNIWNWLNNLIQKTSEWLNAIAQGNNLLGQVGQGIQGAVNTVQGWFGGGQQQQQGQQAISGKGGAIASPLIGQSLEALVAYRPSAQQGFFGVRDGGRRRHSKVDFDSRVGGGQGAAVAAAMSGLATWRPISSNSAGINIEATDPQGRSVTVVYNHLSLAEVQKVFGGAKSMQVSAGQRIGSVTMDSLSSGPHLDWGIKVNGQYVDPQKYIRDVMIPASRQPQARSGGASSGGGAGASWGTAAPPSRNQGGVLWGHAARYSPSDLSGLTARGRQAMEALKNPRVRAFLDAVAVAEIGDVASRGGYGFRYGDTSSESYNPNTLQSHPEQFVSKWGYRSNATGRYQVVQHRDAKVWDEERGRLGLRDFKPQAQELLAVSRLMYRKILPDIMAGNVTPNLLSGRGFYDASNEWASIQGNPYGQGTPGGKQSTFLANYNRFLQQYQSGGANQINSIQFTTTPAQAVAQAAGRGRGAVPQFLQPTMQQGMAIAANNTAQQQALIQSQTDADLERRRQEYLRAQKRNIDQFRRAGKDLDDRRKDDRRQIEDLASGIGQRTPQKDFQENLRGIDRQYHDAVLSRQSALKEAQERIKTAQGALASGAIASPEKEVLTDRLTKDQIMVKELQAEITKLNQLRSQATQEAEKLFNYEEKMRRTAAYRAELQEKINLINAQIQGKQGDPIALKAEADKLNQIVQLSEKMEALDRQKREGTITLDEYNKQNDLLRQQDEIIRATINTTKGLESEERRRTAMIALNARDIESLQAKLALGIDPIGTQAEIDDLERINKLLTDRASLEERFRNKEISESQYQRELVLLNETNKKIQERIDLTAAIARQQRDLEVKEQFTGMGLELTRTAASQIRAFQQRNPFNYSMGDADLFEYEARRTEQLMGFERQKFDLQELARTGQRSKEEVAKLIEMLERLNGMKLGQIKAEYDNAIVDREIQESDFRFGQRQRVFQSGQDLLNAQIGLARTRGLDTQSMEKQGAIASTSFEHEGAARELDNLVRSGQLASDTAAQLRINLEQLNQVKLADIQAQFDPWNQALVDTKQGFQQFLTGIISGSQSIDEAFKGLVQSIINSLANLAAQWITNQLFGQLFGGGGGMPMGGGMGGGNFMSGALGAIGSLFGFAEGGIVPTGNFNTLRQGNGAIATALRKEGNNSVLAALTPGEIVLSLEQAKRFRSYQMDRVLNFSSGGIVPGGSVSSAIANNNNMTVNIPVTVNGGSDGVDVQKFRQVLDGRIREVISEESRPGGSLRRGR